MSRHGRRRQQRPQRGSSHAVPLASIPQQAPSADALASGRVVMLSNQASSRGVASYAATAAALQAQSARQVAQVSPSQPGVMSGTDKQYPAMPKIAHKSPLLESMGAPGTAIFQGIITNDDYNPDFYWRDAVEIYDQMIRNDGQIMAIVQQLELPIRRATWTVEPFADTPRDKEVASFIESCLFHDLVRTTADGRRVYQKWDDILRHALMMLRYGFAVFEKVWRKEDGWVKLAHLMPMLPMSVYRWWVGQDNELVGIQQYTFKNYTYCFVDIPADKVLLFTHRMEGQNYEGFSLLRAAYKHWYYKDQFYKIDAVGLERNAIAVPFIKLPASFNETDVLQAQAILANLRANESMGVTLPFGWEIGYIPNSEHYAGHALKSIEHHDILIARAVLAQFINLGSGETGTYNLAVDQRQDLLESLQAEAEYIEDTFNADLIPQLCDFNFSGLAGYPRIKASKLAQADITDLIDSISKLKAKDANFITPDDELEDWIRDQLGAPKATRSVIAGENPTAPTTPQRPDAQPGQPGDHSDAESKPVKGKPAPESTDAQDGGDDDGGEAGVSAASAQASDSLASDTKLLAESMAESLAIIAGLDATERGLYAAERLDSMTLFNPNHDPHSGEFSSGGGGGASNSPKGGEHLARAQENHARALAHLNDTRARVTAARDARNRAAQVATRANQQAHDLEHGGAHQAARERAKEALFQERLAKAQERNTKAYQKYKEANEKLPGLKQAEDRALNDPARQAAFREGERIVAQGHAEGKSDAEIARMPEYRAAQARSREMLNEYVRVSMERMRVERSLESAKKQISGKYITEERIAAHPLAATSHEDIARAQARADRANQLLSARAAEHEAAKEEEARAQSEWLRAQGELDVAQGGSGYHVRTTATPQQVQDTWHGMFGKDYSEKDLGALAGARTGDTIHIETATLERGQPFITVRLEGHAENTFSIERHGNDVVLHTGYAGRKSGTERNISNAQDIVSGMRSMERLGITRVETTAAGGGGFGKHDLNGYYTWARLGFTGRIENESLRAAASARFGRNITRVEQVMRQPGGPQWWKRNGDGFDATFSFKNRYSQAALRSFETLFTRQSARVGATKP